MLEHTALALPNLKSLTLHKSPALLEDLGAYAAAIAAFRATLTHLGIDTWIREFADSADTASALLRPRQTQPSRPRTEHCMLSSFISGMKVLKSVSMRDWGCLKPKSRRPWLRALRKLRDLEEIRVSPFPCTLSPTCGKQGGACEVHPRDLPFVAHGARVGDPGNDGPALDAVEMPSS